MSKKAYDKFTATDLRRYWLDRFRRVTGKEYFPGSWAGRELQELKGVLASYNVWDVLLAIRTAVREGESSIHFFCENIRQYLTDSRQPRLQFLVLEHGGPEQKKLWLEYSVYETKWLQNAADLEKLENLASQLETWASGITGVKIDDD